MVMNTLDEVNKIEKYNLTEIDAPAPYFKEARLVLICKKLYSDMVKRECFVDGEFAEKMYPDGDLHKLYVGEIVKVLERE